MNKMGFGFLRFPQQENGLDWEAINQMVDAFMARGGTYFDTCYTYLKGLSEEAIRRCVTERYPREKFQLAEKLPGYLCKSEADAQKFFDEELKRCGVDYFDVYMLHWLNGDHYAIAERYDQFRFLREKKAEGKAKRIGFSYHDSASLLEEILIAHPEVDVVQLQLNYLDWESAGIEARKCYEICMRHRKSVIVMEPLKGGTLAELPEDAKAHLQAMHADWSAAEWALRFVQGLPGVEICLSGMNSVPQVEMNMRPVTALTEEEKAHLFRACPLILGQTAIACTACRYCVSHCPKGISIPDCFKLYNEICRYPKDGWKIRPNYAQLTKQGGKASDCIACHSCERHCPQHLPISDTMKLAAEKLE